MPGAAIVGVRARRHPRAGSDIQWNSPARGCRRSRTRFDALHVAIAL